MHQYSFYSEASAINLAVSAKGRQRTAHRRTALFPGAGNQTVPGEFFLRSFDGNARASGAAESPDPRRSEDLTKIGLPDRQRTFQFRRQQPLHAPCWSLALSEGSLLTPLQARV